MSTIRIIIGIVVSAAALAAGCLLGMGMGGFGICGGLPFSASLVWFVAALGAVFAATISLLWRQVWWAGALAFSGPTLFGAAFAAAAGEWQRVVGIGICILASVLTAFVVRYPGPNRLKQ